MALFRVVRQLYHCRASTVLEAVHTASDITAAVKIYSKAQLTSDLKRCAAATRTKPAHLACMRPSP